jgi:uncharacterized membrane protein YfcA
MSPIFIILIAFAASILTFFSGFGLGTLLLPAMTLYYPLPIAIVLTGIVHFINGAFKVVLLRRHIQFKVLLRFAVLAIPFAFIGSNLLSHLDQQRVLFEYNLWGQIHTVAWINLVVGSLMIGFTLIELIPGLKNYSFDPRFLPIGGAMSGFFGGLTGHQGAFRSMFLVRVGLTKEQFVATGSAFSFLVDLTRISVYLKTISINSLDQEMNFLYGTIAAAVMGSILGDRLLKKVNIHFIKILVSTSILILGLLIASGLMK